MAYVALRRCEYELAGHHHARAAALNPNDPQTMAQRANWLMHVGRLEEALATLDASLERDPFPPTWYWDVRGYVLYHLRRYREAVLAFRSVGAEPFWIAGMLAAAHAQDGDPEAAAAELERYLEASPGRNATDGGRPVQSMPIRGCASTGSRGWPRQGCRLKDARPAQAACAAALPRALLARPP